MLDTFGGAQILEVLYGSVCECPHGIEECDNPKELLDALPSKKRRRTMTFSEFTDYVIEFDVHDESALWGLAKRLKVDKGEAVLWNYLESQDLVKIFQPCWPRFGAGGTMTSCLQAFCNPQQRTL